ncbi:MAG: polysaccharide deacetylase family protein [Cytophagales bacterium]
MIHKTPRLLKFLYPSLVWNVPTNEKKIFLTFDDGPIPEVTEFVLETLAQYNAKAVFFCVGDNIKKHPEVFLKVVNEGHKIGNHTFNHLKGWKTDNNTYFENIQSCEEIIGQYSSGFFRAPYGRIKRSQIKHLKSKYKIIMWDVLSADYEKFLSKEKCLEGTIKATRNGSIVLFHDHLKTYEKIKYVLPKYLDHFSKLGYTFELIP